MSRNPARPGDRGANRRVVQLDLGGLHRGRIRSDRGVQLSDKRVLRVELLLGGEILLGERRVSGEIELGVGEVGLVLRFLGDRLIESGLKRPRIDFGEKIAFIDHLAFLEADLVDLAIDARTHRYRIESLDLPEAVKDQRKIDSRDRRYGNANWREGRRRCGPVSAVSGGVQIRSCSRCAKFPAAGAHRSAAPGA